MKIKLACIKFAGMASSGVEKYLQTITALLPKDKFDIDFRASGFPDELTDNEKEEKGYEI